MYKKYIINIKKRNKHLALWEILVSAPVFMGWRRFADKLVKLHLKNGQEELLLVQVEVQAQEEQEFAARMYTYSKCIHVPIPGKLIHVPIPGKCKIEEVIQYTQINM
jgi:hypothetical protein